MSSAIKFQIRGPRLLDVATWESWGFFCFAPQDFGGLGVFYARVPPREASKKKIQIPESRNIYNTGVVGIGILLVTRGLGR